MKALLIAVACCTMMAGCATGKLPDDYCDWQCQKDLKQKRDEAYVNIGIMYGGFSDEYRQRNYEERMALAKHREEAARGEYITTNGPKLEAYGPVGASAYSQVVDCKLDVSQALIHDQVKRERFEDMCYDLLPEDKRQEFKDKGKHVPLDLPLVVPVIIVAPAN